MQSWFEALKKAVSGNSAAVLVTVIAVDGSVPREPGATLVVSADSTEGTIGGGNLEYSAIARARTMLDGSPEMHGDGKHSDTKQGDEQKVNSEHECLKLSLGPSLGQCCGGRVELLFERVSSKTEWLIELTTGHEFSKFGSSEKANWLFRQLDSKAAIVATPDDFQKQELVCDSQTGLPKKVGVITSTRDNSRWFCMPLIERVPIVWVYGAGHVGQAVVRQLSLMACQITWLDHREDWLELQPELSINRVLTDSPDDEIGKSPAKACHIVMTHSHAIDFDICHALLKSGQFGYLGLIGSESKRRTFVRRLRQRGHDDDLIDCMRCPIGRLQLASSVPSVIALNLAAELAVLWEQTGTI